MTTKQEGGRHWVFLGLDRWPVVGSLVKRDQKRFLEEQARGESLEKREPEKNKRKNKEE